MDLLGMPLNEFKKMIPDWTLNNSTFDLDRSEELFTKVKHLKSKHEKLELPPSESYFTSAPWRVDHLDLLKEELNKVKSLLNDFQPGDWQHHTKRMNPMTSVVYSVRKVSHEFCSIAWCKLFEILSCHRAIPTVLEEVAKELGSIRMDSVHLCEAPGAFISATNHYLKTTYEHVDWDWRATSLSPYYEGNNVGDALTQDDLVLGTVYNWTWLKDQTGNIMDVQNVIALEAEMKGVLRNVQLVTADGSFECADAPGEQEAATSGLHYCEIMAALGVLEKGGTFVLKLFTFFEANTICTLYLLACLFEEVDVVKPATSKEGNSEVYLVCRGYSGSQYKAEERRVLVDAIDKLPFTAPLFSRETIPDTFLNSVAEAALFYASQQISVIVRNVQTYQTPMKSEALYEAARKVQYKSTKKWLNKTNLDSLDKSQFIFRLPYSKKHYGFKNTFRAPQKVLSKSLTERVHCQRNEKQPNYSDVLLQDLLELKAEHATSNEPLNLTTFKVSNLKIVRGKKYNSVQSSRFCDDLVLMLGKRIEEFITSCGLIEVENILSKYSCFCILLDNHKISSAATLCRFKHQSGGTSSMLDNTNNMQLLQCILTQIAKLCDGDNLFLCSFSLLSRINYSLVLLIANTFESIQLLTDPSTKSYGILLSNFKGTSHAQWWPALTEALMIVKEEDDTGVLELLPIQHLCQKKNYRNVDQYNNAWLLYHCELQLDHVCKSIQIKVKD